MWWFSSHNSMQREVVRIQTGLLGRFKDSNRKSIDEDGESLQGQHPLPLPRESITQTINHYLSSLSEISHTLRSVEGVRGHLAQGPGSNTPTTALSCGLVKPCSRLSCHGSCKSGRRYHDSRGEEGRRRGLHAWTSKSHQSQSRAVITAAVVQNLQLTR